MAVERRCVMTLAIFFIGSWGTRSALAAEKLTADDVAIAIGSSAIEFCNRWEQYSSKWWRPEYHAVVMVDRNTPEVQQCLDGFVQRFPGLNVEAVPTPPAQFEEWSAEGGGERIIWSQIHVLWRQYPSKKWYFLIDDDTIILLDNLLTILADYDHQTPVYLGGTPNERKSFAYWARHNKPMVVDNEQLIGGAGIVISAALMEQLEPTFDECLLTIWGGDERLQACIRRMGVKSTIHPAFHQLNMGLGPVTDIFEAHPAVPVVSLHHFGMEQIEIYFKFFDLNTTLLAHAMMADQGAFLQQTVCTFERMGTFSIANGFSVRWWDDVVDPEALLQYTPFLTHVPKERYLFTGARPVQHAHSPQLAYEYLKDYKTLNPELAHKRHAYDWRGVRVVVPANASWSRGAMCCEVAYETADRPDVAELIVAEC